MASTLSTRALGSRSWWGGLFPSHLDHFTKLRSSPPTSPSMMSRDPAQRLLLAIAAGQGFTPCIPRATPTTQRMRKGLIRSRWCQPYRRKQQAERCARDTKWKNSRSPLSTHLAPGNLYICDSSGWGPSLAEKKKEAHQEGKVMVVRDVHQAQWCRLHCILF